MKSERKRKREKERKREREGMRKEWKKGKKRKEGRKEEMKEGRKRKEKKWRKGNAKIKYYSSYLHHFPFVLQAVSLVACSYLRAFALLFPPPRTLFLQRAIRLTPLLHPALLSYYLLIGASPGTLAKIASLHPITLPTFFQNTHPYQDSEGRGTALVTALSPALRALSGTK